MKNLFFLFMLFMIISCSSNKVVYWCGDHPCINKKEKKAYFKKNMIVEMKSIKSKNYKNNSEIEKIMQESQKKEKIRIKNEKNSSKQIKLEEKSRIKQEKDLAKQIKLEEKRRIKEEKNLVKQIKLEEKKRIKDTKKSSKRKINVNKEKQLKKAEIDLEEFSELVEKITIKNTFKPYPDINEIPN